ncbi:MAG: acetyltransferase [Sphingobium sp.]|uniref:MuF-C-terminal domain-containing protein n=1 Tax=Sphingobium sp. TaxID=1912891 RepID=UPI003BB091ED
MDDLSKYLSPTAAAASDPLDDLLNERAKRLRADALRSLPPPDAAARANEMSRVFGVTPTQADTHLQTLEQQGRIDRAVGVMERHPPVGAWADANPRAAAAAGDDYQSIDRLGTAFLTRLARDKQDLLKGDGFLDRIGDLFKVGLYGISQGAASVRGALTEWSANNPLPWTSSESIATDRRRAAEARAVARIYGDIAGTTVSNETDWATVKRRPTPGNILSFGLDQGVKSVPGMVQAATALPLYILGQAGNIGTTRAQVQGREDATAKDIVEAAPAAVLSGLLERVGIHGIFGAPARSAIGRVAQAAGIEATTEFGQSAVEYIGGHSQTGTQFDIGEMLDQSLAGAVAGGLMGGGIRTGVEGGRISLRPARSLLSRVRDADTALNDAAVLSELGEASAASKLRQRDPEAFGSLIRELADEAGSDRVYVPSDVVRAYMQSDTYDGEFDRWSDQIDDAVVTGGDWVIPIDTALTEIAGTKAWDAVRDDIRLTPGGMSPREAQTFNDAMADVLAELSERMADEDRAARELGVPRDKLFQSIADKLMNAGFTPNMARQNAELLTQRAATRAARMGRDLSGDEYAGLEVRQVLPANIAAAQKADQLDVTISVMQRQKDASQSLGPSLMDFISKGGGVVDKGGDLKAMGADAWHKGKPGKRKIIRPDNSGQSSMLADGGLGVNEYGPDAWALRAWEAGYFPDFPERPTANDLLDAVAEGVAGRDRYLVAREKTLRDSAEELRALLENRGIDPDTASRQEIRAAVDAYVADQVEGDGFEQSAMDKRAWERAIDAIVRGDRLGRPLVRLGATPNVLRALGFPEGEMVMARAKIARARREHPEVSLAIWKSLPDLVSDPRGVFPSRRDDGSFVILVEGRDANGDPIFVPVTASQDGSTVVLSMYGKTGGDDIVAADLRRAQTEGKDFYVREGLADDLVTPKEVPGAAPPHAPIASGVPAKPERKILSRRDVVKKTLDQSGDEQQPRGRIIFPGGQSATAIIELFQGQDQSTFLHESGHLFLEELREDAADPDAPQQVRDDWQLVQGWFAANGHPLADGVIPVEAHEMWARGVERYLMEGKAPSPGLRRMFQTFKAWLISLYNSVSRLRSPITDEIRGVMDRLVATDEELADAVAAQHLEALFPSKPTNMTADEYDAYQALTINARDAAQDKLLAKMMNAVRRRVTKEYKEREAEVRSDVTERIDARPEFRAMRQLKDTPMDSSWVRDRFGEDATAMLPMQVPPVHRQGGANPDDVAEIAGYGSGEEMVSALLGVEIRRREMRGTGDKRSVRKALIDQEVEAIMMDRYGDPFTDGSIEEEALAAVHSDQQGEVMAAELRVLARSTGDRVTPYSVARDWASRQVREGRVADVASRSAIVRYERAAAKAGKAAMEAVIAGDNAEAFKQKQAQMLNNALVAEAKRAADDVDAAVSRLEKWAKRRTVKSVDQDYLERAQLLLEQVEMKERTQRSLNRQESFEAWAAARQAEGYDVVVPPSFAESLGKTHWSRLSVEKLLGLDEAVKQIIHLGRLKQTLLDGQEERAFEAVVKEAMDGFDGMKHRPPSDLIEPSRWDAVKGKVAAFDAALLKMEQVFDWLDGGNSNGVFNRIVFRPIADAQAREAEMTQDYFARIRAEFGKLDRAQLRRWSERFTAPELFNSETGRPYQMRREQLIAIALNMGNAGNIQRLTDGYGWRESSVRAVLNRELTPADWQFVQNVWDIIETLWPQIAAMERRVNGVEPDKVEAQELVTPTATLRGGYYPAIYDTAKSYVAEEHAGKGSDLLDTIYTRANTRASSTRERSEKVKRPILLQLGVINRHLGEVIHDITHREAVIQADKFLRSERIMRGVDDTLGPEIRKQFRPWLKYVANSWAMERAGNEGVGAFMQKLRSNTTVVGMGFRFTTMLTQLAGYSNSFEYVGARWVSAALGQAVAHPVETFNFVMEKSSEVRNRMDTLDRDIRQTLAQMQGRKEVITAAKRFAFHGIGYMDRMVVVPTWIGAFNKAQAEGMDEASAIYAADKAVRLSQGAGSPKDLVAVARGTGKYGFALQLMTQFYSFMSAFYQRQRTLGRDVMAVRHISELPAILARAWWLIVVPPILSQLLAGRGPDDDEDWGFWAFKQMLFQSLGPIPGLRDLAPPVWQALAGDQPFDYQFTPLQRAFQSVVDVAQDARKIVEGEDAKRPVRNALEAVGYWTGLVPGQVATSTQFLVDVANGEQDPDTFNDWYQGLTKGKVEA